MKDKLDLIVGRDVVVFKNLSDGDVLVYGGILNISGDGYSVFPRLCAAGIKFWPKSVLNIETGKNNFLITLKPLVKI